jgi:hypothetical protein
MPAIPHTAKATSRLVHVSDERRFGEIPQFDLF